MEISKHTPGMFCWVELGTTDQLAAKKFYSHLFGWTFNDIPMGPDNVYTMFQLKGKDVAALYQLDKDQQARGVPPHWMLYIAAESADEAAKKVTAAGGNILAGPFDVFDVGRMAVAHDPTGAHFSLWQARKHGGVQIKDENNALCWQELATNDTAAAKDFYSKVFGWNPVTRTDVGEPYTEFFMGNPSEGKHVGGMMQMTADFGNIPPHWMSYFAVDNCESAVERAISGGGTVVVPPMDVPNVGRFSVLQDPQGAALSVIKLNY